MKPQIFMPVKIRYPNAGLMIRTERERIELLICVFHFINRLILEMCLLFGMKDHEGGKCPSLSVLLSDL